MEPLVLLISIKKLSLIYMKNLVYDEVDHMLAEVTSLLELVCRGGFLRSGVGPQYHPPLNADWKFG